MNTFAYIRTSTRIHTTTSKLHQGALYVIECANLYRRDSGHQIAPGKDTREYSNTKYKRRDQLQTLKKQTNKTRCLSINAETNYKP